MVCLPFRFSANTALLLTIFDLRAFSTEFYPAAQLPPSLKGFLSNKGSFTHLALKHYIPHRPSDGLVIAPGGFSESVFPSPSPFRLSVARLLQQRNHSAFDKHHTSKPNTVILLIQISTPHSHFGSWSVTNSKRPRIATSPGARFSSRADG